MKGGEVCGEGKTSKPAGLLRATKRDRETWH